MLEHWLTWRDRGIIKITTRSQHIIPYWYLFNFFFLLPNQLHLLERQSDSTSRGTTLVCSCGGTTTSTRALYANICAIHFQAKCYGLTTRQRMAQKTWSHFDCSHNSEWILLRTYLLTILSSTVRNKVTTWQANTIHSNSCWLQISRNYRNVHINHCIIMTIKMQKLTTKQVRNK